MLEALLPPKFHRIAPGDYETADGVFRLRQLDGGQTRAWNVEWTTEFEAHLHEAGLSWHEVPGYPVDGAETKREALALFAEWWAGNGHPAPSWSRS